MASTESFQNFQRLIQYCSDSYNFKAAKIIENQLSKKIPNTPKDGPIIILVVGSAPSTVWAGIDSWSMLSEKIIKTICESFTLNSVEMVYEHFRKAIPQLPEEKIASHPIDIGNEIFKIYCNAESDIKVDIFKIIEEFDKFSSLRTKIRKAAAEAIQENKDKCNQIQLGYELIAHLFKHDIIDHIFNFNFDGLLDDTLENEMTLRPERIPFTTSYQYSTNKKNSKGKYHVKKVLNIHGHIDVPTSIRISKKEVDFLREELYQSINECFTDPYFDRESVVILSIGYSWSDLGIINFIKHKKEVEALFKYDRKANNKLYNDYYQSKRALKKEDKQLHFSRFLESLNQKGFKSTLLKETFRNEFGKVFKPIYANELAPNQDEKSGSRKIEDIHIDEFLWVLWNEIKNNINKKPFEIREATRHEIIGKIFGLDFSENVKELKFADLEPNHKYRDEHYLLFEFIIFWFASSGIVSISNLARVKRIYKIFKKSNHNNSINLRNSSLKQILKKFQHKVYNDSFEDLLIHKDVFNQRIKNEFIEEFLSPIITQLDKKIRQPKVEKNQIIIDRTEKFFDFLERKLLQIGNHDIDIEIIPGLDPRLDLHFNCPSEISNWAEFRYLLKNIIISQPDHLFIISENGRWAEEIIEKEKIKLSSLHIIGANYDLSDNKCADNYIKAQNEIFDKKVKRLVKNIYRSNMYWFAHNQHLVFGVKNNSIHEGIYYLRRNNGLLVSPVYLKQNKNDLKLLKNIFKKYLLSIKAENDNNKKRGLETRCLMNEPDQLDKNIAAFRKILDPKKLIGACP